MVWINDPTLNKNVDSRFVFKEFLYKVPTTKRKAVLREYRRGADMSAYVESFFAKYDIRNASGLPYKDAKQYDPVDGDSPLEDRESLYDAII